ESRFDARAISRSGARGLMQLMPTTAAGVAKQPALAGKNVTRLEDPAFNLELGQRYLQMILKGQSNNLIALAAAYNSGPANLSRWLSTQNSKDDALLFIETIPRAETRTYIKRVMMNLWMYRKRLNEPADGLDEAASGAWPLYNGGISDDAEGIDHGK